MGAKVGEIKIQKSRLKLILVTLFFGVLSWVLSAYVYDFYTQEDRGALESILSDKSQSFRRLIDHGMKDVQELARKKELVELLDHARKSSSQESPVGKGSENLFHILTNIKNEKKYMNVALLSTQGEVILSLKKDEEGSVLKDPTTILAESFVRARMALTIDVSEFGYYREVPSYFITAPVLKGNGLVGFITVQMSTSPINKITSNIEGLQRTGEVILAKKSENTLVYAAPTRKNKGAAFKDSVSPLDKKWPYVEKACMGEKSDGVIGEGEDNTLILGNFIPKLNLGLVVKRKLHESRGYTDAWYVLFYLTLCIALGSFCSLLYLERHSLWQTGIRLARSPALMRRSLEYCITFMVLMILSTAYLQHQAYQEGVRESTEGEQKKLVIANRLLNTHLLSIANLGHSLAEDFRTGRLRKEDIEGRIKRDLSEHEDIGGIAIAFTPGAVGASQALHAPYVYRDGQKIVTTKIEKSFDYTNASLQLIPWYTMALKSGVFWTRPYLEPISKVPGVSFAVPLTLPGDLKTPIGVVSIFLPIQSLSKEILGYDGGDSGYYVLLTKNGEYLHHRDEENIYTHSHKTLYDIAQENENSEFGVLGRAISEKKQDKLEFFNSVIQRAMWMSYGPLNSTDWLLGRVHMEGSTLMAAKMQQKDILVLFLMCALLLVFLSAYFGKVYTGNIHNLKKTFVLASGTLLVCSFVLWIGVDMGVRSRASYDTPVTDNRMIAAFISNLHKKSDLFKEKKITPIPTGFFINAIELQEDLNKIPLNAQVWQELDASSNHEEIMGFSFPQASKIMVTEVHREVKNGKAVRVWDVKAELFQQLSHKYYPFDIQKIKISLEPRDTSAHHILVPLVNAYQSTLPEATPGISPDMVVPGFTTMKTYFNFSEGIETLTEGTTQHAKLEKNHALSYNLVLKRSLINSVVIHVVPIFVTLFMLFATILLLHKWFESSLSVLTALIFTMVLVHRHMRGSLGASEELLYLEYILFATYCMLILSIMYVILHSYKFDDRGLNSKAKIIILSLFWPINFLLWIISTCAVFFWD